MVAPKKKNTKDALSKSLEAEQEAVTNRFEKAESVLKPTAEVAPEPEPEAPPKQKREKVVRQMVSMPPSDVELLEKLHTQCLKQGRFTNKSEIIRAGLYALSDMSEEAVLQILSGLVKQTPGTPKREN